MVRSSSARHLVLVAAGSQRRVLFNLQPLDQPLPHLQHRRRILPGDQLAVPSRGGAAPPLSGLSRAVIRIEARLGRQPEQRTARPADLTDAGRLYQVAGYLARAGWKLTPIKRNFYTKADIPYRGGNRTPPNRISISPKRRALT